MPLQKKPMRFHSLKRPKFRADMRKENVYKLATIRLKPFTGNRTFFQQKWTAKSLSRAYHGQHVGEKHWTRMFDRRVNAVVPMNPDYLARQDGSVEAAGRGSGRVPSDPKEIKRAPRTPYMQMVYHPLERRLDMAIFRSLFAPSAKYARQLVLHGAVKVNGKPFKHPSYLLNPGDMFQVNPERVMYAMGRRRTKGSVIKNRYALGLAKPPRSRHGSTSVDAARQRQDAQPAPEPEDEPYTDTEQAALDEETHFATQETAEEVTDQDPAAAAKRTIKTLTQRTKAILDQGKAAKSMPGKLKRDFRALVKDLRTAMSRASSATPSSLDDLEATLQTLEARHDARSSDPAAASAEPDAAESAPSAADAPVHDAATQMKIQAAAARLADNPHDPSKPYATPWRPRRWLSVFAFIPRYLEVNQNICAAVYLRHPVAGPGFGEVPTPFHPETGQLAHAWYLRRR